MKKLKRVIGKYKCKLPLKCFECGRISHFASKCPYKGNPNSDDKNNYKTNKSFQRHKKENNGRTVKSKNFYSKEDNNSSNDDSDSDNDSEKVLFMAIDTKEITNDHDESEEEGEVYLEVELISALEELHKERKKKRLLNKELSRIREDIQDSTISKK